MITGIAIVLYALFLYGLKSASRDFEEEYHRTPESMTHYSRRIFLRREDAIEMAIFCNALFWVLLFPVSLLDPADLADSVFIWFVLWFLRLWIWFGAAVSSVPLVKALRYVITQRPGVMREIAELKKQAAEEEALRSRTPVPEA